MKKTFNILFVCRHNRFKSKFAESYFKKINRNPKILARSAGIFPGAYPLDKIEVETSKKFGVELKGYPKPVTTRLLRWNDLIILITNDIKNPYEIFNYGKYKNKFEVWGIEDNNYNSKEKVGNIYKQIIKRVSKLNKELKNEN